MPERERPEPRAEPAHTLSSMPVDTPSGPLAEGDMVVRLLRRPIYRRLPTTRPTQDSTGRRCRLPPSMSTRRRGQRGLFESAARKTVSATGQEYDDVIYIRSAGTWRDRTRRTAQERLHSGVPSAKIRGWLKVWIWSL